MQETLTLTILILDLECGSKVDLFWTYITTPLCTHRANVSQMQIPHLNSELGVSGLPAQAVFRFWIRNVDLRLIYCRLTSLRLYACIEFTRVGVQ